MFHTQICANAQTLQVMEGCECCKWKIPIVFLRIKIVNISPATRDLQISTACSATAPCTAWSTAPGIPGISRKMADGSRIARAAPSRMIRSIMIRSCRFCGRIRHCPTAAAKMVAGSGGRLFRRYPSVLADEDVFFGEIRLHLRIYKASGERAASGTVRTGTEVPIFNII